MSLYSALLGVRHEKTNSEIFINSVREYMINAKKDLLIEVIDDICINVHHVYDNVGNTYSTTIRIANSSFCCLTLAI